MTPPKPRALFLLDPRAFENVYGAELSAEIGRRVEVAGPPLDAAALARDYSVLAQVEIIFSSWGMPRLDERLLAAAPKLRAVFHGAGSVKWPTSDAFWARGIPIVSAAAANAIPVAEFAFAEIIFSLKHGWRYVTAMQRERRYVAKDGPVPGAYRSKVGLVSLGAIGRRVAVLLQAMEVEVWAYDPFCRPADADALHVRLASLDELFRHCDVVSLHAPHLPETEGLITGALVAAMKPGATLINTARGIVVREVELIEVLRRRADLTAVLDVTWPEPPAPESPLFTLPNVMLTPHISGAMDTECRRLGALVLEELDRYLAGRPLRWAVTREQLQSMA